MSAAAIAALELAEADDARKNEIFLPVPHPTHPPDFLRCTQTTIKNQERSFGALGLWAFRKRLSAARHMGLLGNLRFARQAGALLLARRKVVAKMVADILGKPFDFTKKEELETDPDKLTFAKDEAALRDRWRKVLKLQALERVQICALGEPDRVGASLQMVERDPGVRQRPGVSAPCAGPAEEANLRSAKQEVLRGDQQLTRQRVVRVEVQALALVDEGAR